MGDKLGRGSTVHLLLTGIYVGALFAESGRGIMLHHVVVARDFVLRARPRDRSQNSGMRTRLATFAAAATAALFIVGVFAEPASALPSFARQTGTPCASCHTDFPQLTPFGRRFKLSGYAAGGGENNDAYKRTFGGAAWVPPISLMGTWTYTRTKTGEPELVHEGFDANNNKAFEGLIAYAGAITPNVGAFVQSTYSSAERKFSWEMADVRYANTGTLFGQNLIYGVTLHNSPTLQDVWNRNYPVATSDFVPAPAATTMLEGRFMFQVAGLGAYVWANDLVYAEISGYRSLSLNTLTRLGVDADMAMMSGAISNVAPYWRFAVEPTWGNHSLQIGTFGMVANVVPQRMEGFGTDRITDIGVDSQYQYIAGSFSISTRVSYIREVQNLGASQALGMASNSSNSLNSFRASGTFVWGENQRIAVTGAYFNTSGSSDPMLYASSANGSPNNSGWIAEIAYIPYGMKSPQWWPWFNARIGLQYTWYEKFNGASTNYDGAGRNASDNNTLLLYLRALI